MFGKIIENIQKHMKIKLVNNDERRNHLPSDPNYYSTKWFSH